MRTLCRGTSLVLSLLFAATAAASIEEWGGALPSTYDIDPTDRTITILQPGDFKFWAKPDENNRDINAIVVQEGIAAGLVTVSVEPPPGICCWGAANLHRFDLSNASSSEVPRVKVGNTLGRDGATILGNVGTIDIGGDALSPIVIKGLSGNLWVGEAADITISGGEGAYQGGTVTFEWDTYTGTLTTNVPLSGIRTNGGARINGNVVAHANVGVITMGPSATGNVVVDGNVDTLDPGSGSTGDVIINGDVVLWLAAFCRSGGTISVHGNVRNAYLGACAATGVRTEIDGDVDYVALPGCEATGDLYVGGSVGELSAECVATEATIEMGQVTERLEVLSWLGGTIRITGDAFGELELAPIEQQVEILGDLVGTMNVNPGVQLGEYGDIGGEVHIGGSLLGEIAVSGTLRDGGHIRIDGGFGDSTHVARIELGQTIVGEDCYVTVDYDGWHEDDEWDPISYILYQGQSYHGNTPGLPFYRITSCRGDMLNDGWCDFYDIDALILAFDPEAFEDEYPAIAGGRLYHGDLNCSGTVDFYDIDAFVARLNSCESACWSGNNMQGGGEGQQMQMMGGGAALIAAQLAAGVSPENMPALIAAIEQLALDPPANSITDWSAVLAALAGM